MTRLIETLISGLSLGSIYALMALGYTMVYGIAKMLNFAHGDIIMVGAYAVVTSVLTLGMPPLVAILISIAICALLGITVEFLAYRPLRQAPPLAVLITAIGVSYLLQNLALLIYGSEQKAFPVLVHHPQRGAGRRVHRRHYHRHHGGDGHYHGGAVPVYQPVPGWARPCGRCRRIRRRQS